MKKHTFAVALLCIAVPLGAMAEGGKAKHVHAPNAASAPAPMSSASHAEESRAEIRAAKGRGSNMAVCREEAAAQGLVGAEFKMAMAACMKK